MYSTGHTKYGSGCRPRARFGDPIPLAGHFLAKQRRLSDVRLDPDGLAICRTGHHGWPGDVREP